jgi:D-serine deaminase-like pyridoxal phosphate-dependent protein/RimJ/RimL family protein N-acetyltransferase
VIAPPLPRPLPQRRVLEGRWVRLEPLTEAHAPDFHAALAAPGFEERLRWVTEAPPQSLDETRAWVRRATAAEDPLFFAVVDRAGGRCSGRQALMRMTPQHGVIEIGFIVWGPGIARTRLATEAFFLHARHVFDDLGYRRFEWKCDDENEPSRAAALRFGFQPEGVFRRHMHVRGRDRDTAWFAMLDTDWPALRAEYERWLDPANFDERGAQRSALRASAVARLGAAPALASAPTPALLLDPARLERNARRLRERLTAHGVPLRLHAKTVKCMPALRLAAGGPLTRATVSTLAEATALFHHGVRDLLYAVGVAPQKLARIQALRARGADLQVILDSPEAARAVAASARGGAPIPALIEVDGDGCRAGIAPDAPRLLETAAALVEGGGILRGVLTHAGGSYACRTPEQHRAFAQRERDAAVHAAERLRAAGHAAPVVSIGSTPTATFGEDFRGVTEVRAGVHLFMDLVMVGLGVCALDDLALSVLTTVIGHQPERGLLVVDAGWTALSSDRGTAIQTVNQGYGMACREDGTPLPELIVHGTNQEHGLIGRRDRAPWDLSAFPIGSRLRVLPNHACATATMHGEYLVLGRAAGEVQAIWRRFTP